MDTALDTTLNMTSSLWLVDGESLAPFVSVRGSSVQARLAAVMEAGRTGQQEERGREGGGRCWGEKLATQGVRLSQIGQCI